MNNDQNIFSLRESMISDHYSMDRLEERIIDGLTAMGLEPATVTREILSHIDEFHVGGHTATTAFFDNMPSLHTKRLLDIGCGLGGPARYAAATYGCEITGIDLSPDYVRTGNLMSEWVHLSDKVSLSQASAMELPDAPSFDAAYMIHVGMNIEDKTGLMASVFDALSPGGFFAIYDVMLLKNQAPTYPLPWATQAGHSAVASPDVYREAITKAGFTQITETDRSVMANEFFSHMRQSASRSPDLPPLGLHLLMGADFKDKIANLAIQIDVGLLAPIEMIAHKPG